MSYRDMELETGSSFFKLVSGSNEIRLVSEAIPVYTAFDKEATDGKKSRKFLTKDAAEKFNASVTDEKKKAKVKYACWILDRATDEIVVAEFGTMIMQAIKALALDPTYGFPALPPYDFRITKTGEEMATRYAVLPLPAKELTEDEKKRIEAVGTLFDELKKDAVDAATACPF